MAAVTRVVVLIAPLVETGPDVDPRGSPTACPGRYRSSFARTASRRRDFIDREGLVRSTTRIGVGRDH